MPDSLNKPIIDTTKGIVSDRVLSLNSNLLRAERITSALRNQQWGLSGQQQPFHSVILLASGQGVVTSDQNDLVLNGPCVAWLRSGYGKALKVSAGSEGVLIGMTEGMLLDAIGRNPDSHSLQYINRKSFVYDCPNVDESSIQLRNAFHALLEESKRKTNASWTLLSAYITIISTLIWRLSGGEEIVSGTIKDSSGILQKFRQLIEINYRNRWSVKEYAEEIGVTQDRLYNCCRRELDRTPIQLIHQRILHEAKLTLEKSSLNIEQISNVLGFRDAPHFSHFFKKLTGQSPKEYRQKSTMAIPRKELDQVSKPSFEQWP